MHLLSLLINHAKLFRIDTICVDCDSTTTGATFRNKTYYLL